MINQRTRVRTGCVSLPVLLGMCLYAQEPITHPEDREIALWVLRSGGRVLVDGAANYTSDAFDLPERAFRVVGVDMHGTVVPPIELKPLGNLTELREVLLPARVWSPTFDKKSPFADEMFDYFANSKKLEKFEAGLTTLAYLRLGEPGLERLARLTQLRDVRVCTGHHQEPEDAALLREHGVP